MRNVLIALALLTSAGCVTQKATGLPLPRERATECVAHCESLGMELSAVVIIMNSAGCVCEPEGRTASPGSASAAAGGAAIQAVVAAQRQNQATAQSRR